MLLLPVHFLNAHAEDTLQKPVLFLLNDGRHYDGYKIKEDSNHILIKTIESEFMTLEKSELITPYSGKSPSKNIENRQMINSFILSFGGVSEIESIHYSFGLNFDFYNFSLLFKFGYGTSGNQGGLFGGSINPEQELSESAILIGYQTGRDNFNFSIYGGLNYLSGTKRGKYLYTKNGGWFSSGDEYYEPVKFNDFGFANELNLAYNFGRTFAIGCYYSYYLSKNINSINCGIFFRFTFFPNDKKAL